jgi:quinoprotein glucose dehydrogenase
VFVPTGSAAADFYGANRLGDNLYANCLLALEAATGQLRWHYQFVRHDVLDRDLPSAPTLVTLKRDGKPLDALVQTTKQGFVFVLERDPAQPVFPIEQVPAPATTCRVKSRCPTYLRPVLPAPYARQRLTADELTTRTPEANQWARAEFARLRSDGPFKPLTLGVDTTIYPGFDGGAEWGGPAWDPDTGCCTSMPTRWPGWGRWRRTTSGRSTGKSIYLRDCAACHGDSGRGSPRQQFPAVLAVGSRHWHRASSSNAVRKGGGRMPGFRRPAGSGNLRHRAILRTPARTCWPGDADPPPANPARTASPGYRRWLDPQGYPGDRYAVGHAQRHRHHAPAKYAWRIPVG